jgi:RNA polymerase sigma-70 factor (ECF subfamily)
MGGDRVQNEGELIEEILGGSKAAVEVLVNRYYKGIFSYIYRSTGQYHTSYDLTQEVFIKMIGALNRFDRRSGNFKNWIYKIGLNVMRDYFKGRGYRGFKEAVEIDEERCDEDSNVVEIISRMSQREEIKKAITELPEFQRDAIILRFYHDMKIKDIAAVMDTTESTVKSRLRQGIEKLKNILKDGEVNDETKLGF